MTTKLETTGAMHHEEAPISSFFLLTFAISWLIWLPGVLVSIGLVSLAFDTTVYTILNVAGGFGPTIAGLLLLYRTGGKAQLRDILHSAVGIQRIGVRWWLAILFLIPIIHSSALVLGILTGNLAPDLLLLQQPWIIPLYFVVGLLPISNAIREEFGWRGYAIDRLQLKWNALTSSVIIGFAWGLWHLPLWTFPISAEVLARTPLWVYILNTILLSIIMTWIYNNTSRSMLSAIVFHTILNTSGAVFPFAQTDYGVYFNLLLQIVVAAIIVIYYGHKSLMKKGGYVQFRSSSELES
jgi:membrane protease YdiL (CAAX protease family)